MLGIRCYGSASLLIRGINTIQKASLPKAFLATSSSTLRTFSSDDSSSVGELQSGTVKFYLRSKAYGFIVPDSDPTSEIWVHRTSIDTPHSVEEFPTRPYLMKGESVKFRVEPGPQGQADKAVDVRFLNGRQIPLYRKNYHASVVRGEMQRFGETVFELLKQDSSVEEKWQQIEEAAKSAEDQIALAAERQQQNGPEVEN